VSVFGAMRKALGGPERSPRAAGARELGAVRLGMFLAGARAGPFRLADAVEASGLSAPAVARILTVIGKRRTKLCGKVWFH
jgi:hypothetical protein